MNALAIDGTLQAVSALRYAPSGVAVVEAELLHEGEALEAGLPRLVKAAVPVLALGPLASRLAGETLGVRLQCRGFLAPRSARSTRLVVHVTDYESAPPVAAPESDSETDNPRKSTP